MTLYLGLDVGSTTVKAVVLDEDYKLLHSAYTRHNANQAGTALKLLTEIEKKFPGAAFYSAVCGSGGKPIADAIGADYVQEVVANAAAVRKLHPEASVAIELGGQDAKIVFFTRDAGTSALLAGDMRMNGSCAGGTGAFLDEIAALLRVAPNEFENLARRGVTVHDISGRCGVFAKTDIQPLLNQGALPEDLALSAFHAVAKQTIGGLSQGLSIKPPVIFEGGPLTFNPTLLKVFKERLKLEDGDVIKPSNPELIIAMGAAFSIEELFADRKKRFNMKDALKALKNYHASGAKNSGELVFFKSDNERAAFQTERRLPPPPDYKPKRGEHIRAYLGIDAGSTTSKFVLMRDNEELLDIFYAGNRGEPLRVVKEALLSLKKKYDEAGAALEILGLGTTGYGELLFDKALGADYHTVETVAHAEAAAKYIKDATFILDIGGQDMKAINLSGGIVTNITVNEACSAGCGSFLENFAANLDIPVEKIAESAFSSKNPAELGSRCTVFMNSTIITEQKNGKNANDISAGLCRSIVENVFTKVVRLSNLATLGDKIVVQGGTFKNDAVLCAIEQYLGKKVTRPPYPGEMGAIGIALLTKKHIETYGYTSPHAPSTERSRFVGLSKMQFFDYTQEGNVKCNFCANNCARTLLTFNYGEGEKATWVTGNRCERGEIIGSLDDNETKTRLKEITASLDAVPDLLKEREKLLFADYPVDAILPRRNVTIGIPRVLDFWRTIPFYRTFFRALGFDVKISRRSSKELYESGLSSVASDTVCFPAKLTHGHILDLAAQKVDRIFFPQLYHIIPDNGVKDSVYTCPVLKGYPIVNRYSDDPEKNWNIKFDSPVFHWFREVDREKQLAVFMKDTFGIDAEDTKRAIIEGDKADGTFRGTMTRWAERVIADAEAAGKFAVVIAGRHYQFDSLVNHEVAKFFTNVGIPVIPLDALPGIGEVDLSKTMIDITNNNHARLLSGAIITARHPALEYVEIYSFGCGHDALFTDEVTRLLHDISGKAPLILKLDESDVQGPLRIRIRSFIETVEKRRRLQIGGAKLNELSDPYSVKLKRRDRKRRIVLVPNVSRAFCKVMTAVLRQNGVKAEPLPLGGKEAAALGKKYVHNDSCFPAQMVVGEALLALTSGMYDPRDVIVGTGKTTCDCRLTNYSMLTRKALDDAGFPDVPILTTDFTDMKNIHPGLKFTKLMYAKGVLCFAMADVLEQLRRKIRPYEAQKGETDRFFEESIDSITDGLLKSGMQGAYSAYKKAIKLFCNIEYDRSIERPVIFITGEYLLTFHAGTNYNIERYLEENGMEVAFPNTIDVYHNLMIFHTVSEIKDFGVRHSLYDTLFALLGDKYVNNVMSVVERIAKRHPLFEPSVRMKDLTHLTDHIIHHSMQSGEGFLMAADILHRADKVKSFVILQPFGCLPNHVCGRGVIKKIKEERPDIQILPLDYDPDTSFANIENRLQMLIMNTKRS